MLKWKVWTCSSEELDFTLMPGQHAQKAHNPAHVQIVEGKAVVVCFIATSSLSLLYPEPVSCSVPYMDGLGSGSVAGLPQLPSDPSALLPPVGHSKQHLSAFCYMTEKSLGPSPFWPFKVLPKHCFDSY